jgi:hypothetical protein
MVQRKLKGEAQALNAGQQELVMEFYKFTKGRGHHLNLSASKKGRAGKLQELKQRMVKAGVPGSIIYGDLDVKPSQPSSWVRK